MGNCVLVFAFAPTLASVPGWLYSEANNPLNVQDAVVLAFVPVRGIITLLNAFAQGLGQRVLVGAVAGVLLSVWLSTRGRASTLRRCLIQGALSGALAAGLVVLAPVSPRVLGADLVPRGRAIASAIVSGILCGMIAAPAAGRRLNGSVGVEGAQVDAPTGGA
jgi:hypothetical protein